MVTPPRIPWQVTGNHWLALPCIHPADASVHAIGLGSQALRGSVEFAGGESFTDGSEPALLRIALTVDGNLVELGAGRMAWERVSEWLPAFTSTLGALVVRGTIFAPLGRTADFPGFVYALSLQNTGSSALPIGVSAAGTFGWRGLRVRSSREIVGDRRVEVVGDSVLLTSADVQSSFTLSVNGDGMSPAPASGEPGTWSLGRELMIDPGASVELALYVAAAPERDGAAATADRMRRRGWRPLADETRTALASLQQSTGVAAVDRLVNRNLVFAYFYCVVRALDDARWYLVRSRAPWNGHGMTVRDWDALMWILPAIQLADGDMGRELLLRVCELHGYAPGRGVSYMDGTPFDFAFSIASAAAYAVAVERYITHSGDERIVEDAALAEALYAAHDEISRRREQSVPLYSSEVLPSDSLPQHRFVLHDNAIVAYALDIFKHTLDEKSAEGVESGEAVRAAILRQFAATQQGESGGSLFTAVDLDGNGSRADDPVASAYWLPVYQMVARDSSIYRRTVRRLQSDDVRDLLSVRCAQTVGPDASGALEWLRRAELDNGFAAEVIGADSLSVANGGDAALSALVAYSVWYAVNVLGVNLA